MMNVLLVAVGSALGGVLRYGVTLVMNPASGFPYGTLAVNVVGSFLLGALSGWLSSCTGNVAAMRSFAVIGLCGGFTTFSTFSNEAFRMMQNEQWGLLSIYVLVSVAAGLGAVWLGYMTRQVV